MIDIPAAATGCMIARAVVDHVRNTGRPIRLRALCACRSCRVLRAAVAAEVERRVAEA